MFDELLGKTELVAQQLDLRIVGQKNLKWAILVCLFAGGVDSKHNSHMLIRSYPGLGKTEIASALANALDMKFRRFQFTADVLPKDLFMEYAQDPESKVWIQKEGAIFTNILLADEINRAHPDAHGGLLEAMQEGQVTIEGKTYELPKPFVLIGTLNPIEQRGTYGFVEALKDRFTMQIDIGYPSFDEEVEISRIHERSEHDPLQQVMDVDTVFDIRRTIERDVSISEAAERFIVACVRATRPEENPELRGIVEIGVSSRGVIWLKRIAKVVAFFENRNYVLPKDVERIVFPVLVHRIRLSGDIFIEKDPAEIEEVYSEVVRKIIFSAIGHAKEKG